MAGNILDRPLFKRGPQGDTRVALRKGGGPWWKPQTWFGESQMKLPFKEREVWKKDKETYDLEPSLASQALEKSKNIAKSIGKQSVLYRGNILKKDWTPPKFEGQLGLEGVASAKQKLQDITVDGDPLMSGAGLSRLNPINANPKFWDWKQIMFSPKGALKTGAEAWGVSTAANLLFGSDEAEAIEQSDYQQKETDNIVNSNTAKQENMDISIAEDARIAPKADEERNMLEEMGLPVTTFPTIEDYDEASSDYTSNLMMNRTQENEGSDPVTKIEQQAESIATGGVEYEEDSDVLVAGKIQKNNNAAFPAGTENAISKEFNLNPDRIAQYKDELKELMPRDDKMTSALMLMQLGLGLMTGKSKRGGLGGFLEIAGKAGQDIIPMAMQVLQGKTKFDQEMALAAFQMAREDDKWAIEQQVNKSERYNDLMEKIFLKDYDYSLKQGDPTKGPLKTVYQKIDRKLPSGKIISQNLRWGQVHEDSPLAQSIVYGKPWDMGNGTVIDFGQMGEFVLVGEQATKEFMSEMGLGNRALESGSARDSMTTLGAVFESNLPDIIKFQMQGIHTGEMPTGVAGGTMNWAKKLSENVKGFVNVVRDTTGMTGWNLPVVGFTAQAANDLATSLVSDGSIISYAGLSKDEQKSIKTNGVWVDKSGKFANDTVIIDGQTRQTVAGDAYITDQYITQVLSGRDPWNNEQLMIADQMAHIMGFLEARLKQPTGRLLADTIASSIKDVSSLGFNAGSPERVAQNLYLHTARLYNKYADTMAMANRTPMIEFDMLNAEGGYDKVSIMDYHNSYLNMMKEAGMAPAPAGINLAWTENISEFFPNWNATLGSGAQEGASNSSNIQYKAFGSPAFTEIMKTLTNDDIQTFGGQQYQGQ